MKIHPLYLNGAFTETDASVPVINPATGEAFARVAIVKRAAVGQALQAAHNSFASWRALPGKTRGEFLHKIAGELNHRREEIARLITRENGKPLAQSLAEIALSVDHLQWFAEEARRAYGRTIPHQIAGKRHLVIKSPIGVVGAISPWNFPLMLAVRKVAPALAAGCPVVLKPAPQTPLCALAFAECVHAAGVPAGVFQLVAGPAVEIGQEFLENPICRKITFTGSTAVGKQLIAGAAPTVKHLSLELGGLAPLIIFDDADLERAVEGAMQAKFRNTGQSCIAANNFYVQTTIYPKFLELFTAKVKALNVDDGLEANVDIGPLIDQAAVTKAQKQVDDAVKGGARLLCGGSAIQDRPGFFFAPTVLTDVPPDSLCHREETFAPIVPISSFKTEAEVVARANASPYGLSAYAFTQDLSRAFRLMEALEAGIIGINDGLPTASHAPFGGIKQSGWGRELGSEGLDAFLETKHISLGISEHSIGQ